MFSAGLLVSEMGGAGVRVSRAGARALRNPVRESVVPVPVLPETARALRELLRSRALDLRAASELMRRDPGALLHLLRLVAREYPESEGRPVRLEECLAAVPVDRLLGRLERSSEAPGEEAALGERARHATEIARRAESVGEGLGLEREKAWLVGMLHEFAGAAGAEEAVEGEGAFLRLARQYGLDGELREALDEVHRGVAGSVWVAVIRAAHELQPAA